MQQPATVSVVQPFAPRMQRVDNFFDPFPHSSFAVPPPATLDEKKDFYQFYKNSVNALFATRVLPNLTFPPIDCHTVFKWDDADKFYWRPDHKDVVIVKKNMGLTEEHSLNPETKEPVVNTIPWDVIYPKDLVFYVGRAVQTRMFQAMLAHNAPTTKRILVGTNEIKII